MKNKHLILIFIISLLSIFLLVGCSKEDGGPEELTFEDKEFRAQLLSWLDIKFPDSHEGQITEERLRKHDLTILPIMNYKNISSIEDIKRLPYLEEATIIGSEKLKDYSPLHNLKMLKSLTIVNFQNGGFDELEAIPSLINLDISKNPDINLEFLKKFPNLTRLDASSNKINDLANVKGLQHLERLNLSFNNILAPTDLDSMKSLKLIDLRNNPINNFRWLTKLTNEKLTIMISQDIYNEYVDEKLLEEIEASEEPKIKIINRDEIKIENFLTEHKVIEEDGIKIYVD